MRLVQLIQLFYVTAVRRVRTVLALFLSLGFVIAMSIASQAKAVEGPYPAAEFSAWLGAQKCGDNPNTSEVENTAPPCLEVISVNACSSGCPRRGYNYLSADKRPGRIDLHMGLDYLKALLAAFRTEPSAVLPNQLSFGLTLENMLYEQVQMLLRSSYARFDNSKGPPGVLPDGGRTVDPATFKLLTWITEGRQAQAMQQVDVGLWLLHVARKWADRGHPTWPRYYLQLSERVFNALGVRAAEGGVRNDKTGHRCYSNTVSNPRYVLYCYWFHSFVVGEETTPATVLNQHLHAVRDAFQAHLELVSWRDAGTLPSDLDPDHIAHLLDWGRGGLLQLAFAAGNAADPAAPPNLHEFLLKSEVLNGRQRYMGAYRYTMPYEANKTFPVGPRNITTESSCGYHFHSTTLLASILSMIDGEPTLKADIDLQHAFYGLLYGRNPGDYRSCSNRPSIPPSRKVMNGVPLAELYQGSILHMSFHGNCPVKINNICQGGASAGKACTSNDQCGLDGVCGRVAHSAKIDFLVSNARADLDHWYAGCVF